MEIMSLRECLEEHVANHDVNATAKSSLGQRLLRQPRDWCLLQDSGLQMRVSGNHGARVNSRAPRYVQQAMIRRAVEQLRHGLREISASTIHGSGKLGGKDRVFHCLDPF